MTEEKPAWRGGGDGGEKKKTGNGEEISKSFGGEGGGRETQGGGEGSHRTPKEGKIEQMSQKRESEKQVGWGKNKRKNVPNKGSFGGKQ